MSTCRKWIPWLFAFCLVCPCNVMAKANVTEATCSELSIQIVSAYGTFHQYRREVDRTGYSRQDAFKGHPEKEREYRESVLAADELVRQYRNVECSTKPLDEYLECLDGNEPLENCPQILFESMGTRRSK